MSPIDTLFRLFKLKSLSHYNRIVMPPMSRTFAPGGIPTQAHTNYYRRRAEGGVGLILSEGTGINRPSSMNDPDYTRFHGDKPLAGWKSILESVHAVGGRMGPQFMHAGLVKSFSNDWEPAELPESPSGIVATDIHRGAAMTDEAIADTIAAFAQAAADAKRMGFDRVEIHGGHGYLIDQFFWAVTNTRDGHYGGATLKARSHFAAEVIKETRVAVGPDFPIIMRLSQWKGQDYTARMAATADEMADWLVPLVGAGVDILHCSQRRFWEPEFPELDGKHGLNFAGWAKRLTGAATISVGSVGLSGDVFGAFSGESSTPVRLDELTCRMDNDEFDLIAIGRALITDPNWPQKVRAGDYESMLSFESSALAQLV
jgi:2,4-dienoyl-CoA reductase-like NADH-dependent reductase (Old Yellow Enzyme family)